MAKFDRRLLRRQEKQRYVRSDDVSWFLDEIHKRLGDVDIINFPLFFSELEDIFVEMNKRGFTKPELAQIIHQYADVRRNVVL